MELSKMILLLIVFLSQHFYLNYPRYLQLFYYILTRLNNKNKKTMSQKKIHGKLWPIRNLTITQFISFESSSTWEANPLSLGLGLFLPILTRMLWRVFFKCGSLQFSLISDIPIKYDFPDSFFFSLLWSFKVT